MTRPGMSRLKGGTAVVVRGRRVTMDLPWQTRVVMRKRTGSSQRAESSKAARARS